MAFQNNTGSNYRSAAPAARKFGNAAPAKTSAAPAADGNTKERAPTTHYLVKAGANKGDKKELVRGVFITETQYGLQVSIAEGVEQGLYFINKRKEQVPGGNSNPYTAE